MKFYTYNYILSRIEVTDWVHITLIVLATSVLLFCVFKYYKDKKESKYRELSLIALFLVLILIGIRINGAMEHKAADDGYGAALRMIENLSGKLSVPKEEIIINTQAARDGAIIRIPDNRFYRVINVDGKILLEKMDLYHPEVEIVDVESKK
nr:DUF3290 family protein [uncultured Oribacterium sp.]